MKTNRLDLETRLIHYSLTRLEDRPVEATNSPIEKIELETPPPLTTFEVLFEQPEPEPDESRTSTRSNSYSVNPDDNTVIRRVKAIKARVVKTALDRAICDFYFEEVRNYPQWSERGDVRLPIQLKFISGQVDFTSLEQVCFELEGDRFLFALRRDLEEHGDEALLSVAVNDQLVMILKVRVEIGALEPLDVEQYLEGAWVLSLQSLIDSIKMRRLKETNLRLATGEETNPGGELSSTDPEELAKLKSKFGLK